MPAKDGESQKIAEPLDGPIMNQYCSLARLFVILRLLHLCRRHKNEFVTQILISIITVILV